MIDRPTGPTPSRSRRPETVVSTQPSTPYFFRTAARTRRVGQFGELPAVAATPLVLVVTELLHNAAEHAFPDGSPGSIELVAERDGDDLVVRVVDDGQGLPEGFDPSASAGLGLQIVRTLVASELGGSLAMTSPPAPPTDGHTGTEVVLTLPGAGRPRR